MTNYAATYLFYGWQSYYGDEQNEKDVDKILSIFLDKKVSLFAQSDDEAYINKKLVKKINAQLKNKKLPISCYIAENELHFKKMKQCGGTGDGDSESLSLSYEEVSKLHNKYLELCNNYDELLTSIKPNIISTLCISEP